MSESKPVSEQAIPPDVMEAANALALRVKRALVERFKVFGDRPYDVIAPILREGILAERQRCAEAVKALFRRYKEQGGMPMDMGREEILHAIRGGSK